jgi:hypothetical protein
MPDPLKITRNFRRRQIEDAARLLPGLKLAAGIALNTLNETRSVLELPPFKLIEEPRPAPKFGQSRPKPAPTPAKRKKTGGRPAVKDDLRTRGKRKPPAEQKAAREKLKAIEPRITGRPAPLTHDG